MSLINKYGLSRYLPINIKLEVRQKAGFGCVICGCGIFEYEHIDPPFSECRVHDPKGITLLCPTCHSKKTRGYLSENAVKRAIKNPKCFQKGFSNQFVDLGLNHPIIKFGGIEFINCSEIITFGNFPIMSVKLPYLPGDIYSITAFFFDDNEKLSLSILNNEWMAYNSNWDVNTSGGKIEIRNSKNEYSLRLNFISDELIVIENINLRFRNTIIKGNSENLEITSCLNGNTHSFTNCRMTNLTGGAAGGIHIY